MRSWLRLLVLPALWAGAVSWAQVADAPAGSLQAERARIVAERSRTAARFAAEERACHQRFAVNDCLKANRVWQREVLDDLRRQEVLLNDGERQRKAAEQLRKLDNKQDARARDAAARPEAPAERQPTAPVPAGGKLPREAAAPRAADPQQIEQYEDTMRRKRAAHAENEARRAARASRDQEEASRMADREREAAQHKARTLERNANNPSTAKPLPLP